MAAMQRLSVVMLALHLCAGSTGHEQNIQGRCQNGTCPAFVQVKNELRSNHSKEAGEWVKGEKGQDCNEVCQTIGKECSVTELNRLTTYPLLSAAFKEAGYFCKGQHKAENYEGVPFSTGRHDDCAPLKAGSSASCGGNKYGHHALLCNCVEVTPKSVSGVTFHVNSGTCKLQGTCVESPNYPRPYNDRSKCTIGVSGKGTISAEDFNTESRYDKLMVNNKEYHGSSGPRAVQVSGDIKWFADYSVTRKGWKLCSDTEQSNKGNAVTITIGPSHPWWERSSNKKCVNFANANHVACEEKAGDKGYRINSDHAEASDSFHITVDEARKEICAQRKDSDKGWGMNLQIQCELSVCGNEGEDWRGPANNEDIPGQPIKNINSMCTCESLCKANSECEYWAWNKAVNQCWLKKNFERVTKNSNVFSGWGSQA